MKAKKTQMIETYKKVGDDLEITRKRTVNESYLQKRLDRAEGRLVNAQTEVDNLRAKLAVIDD